MFKDMKAFSGFSVPDLAAAKRFYSDVLGVTVKESPEGLELQLQGPRVFIYHSPTNRPADCTILNFLVPDVDAAVDALTLKGVVMQRYDMPGMMQDEKGIIRGDGTTGPRAIAWFKDPGGNTIAVMQE
jgi:predicted enzyme related to lactoylglutathione lyase